MRTQPARCLTVLATLVLVILAGCDVGIRPGEDGNARFKMDDGMFGEYPHAVGVRAILEVELTQAGRDTVGERAALTVHSDDTDVFTAEWEEPGQRILIEAVGAGQARIELRRPDGSRFDRVAIDAAVADRLAVSEPVPLSTLFGPPPDDVAFDLAEVRIVEGGVAADLHLDIVDAGDARLSGRLDTTVQTADEGVVDVGRRTDSDGAIVDAPIRTNGSFVIVPLAVGETQIQLSQAEIAAEGSLMAHVVAPDAVTEIVWDVDITREAAADPEHASQAMLRVVLRDAEGRTVHGGRCRIFNDTPEIAAIAPGGDGEEGVCFALLGAEVETGVAQIRVEEEVTGLSADLTLPVGTAAENGDDSET